MYLSKNEKISWYSSSFSSVRFSVAWRHTWQYWVSWGTIYRLDLFISGLLLFLHFWGNLVLKHREMASNTHSFEPCNICRPKFNPFQCSMYRIHGLECFGWWVLEANFSVLPRSKGCYFWNWPELNCTQEKFWLPPPSPVKDITPSITTCCQCVYVATVCSHYSLPASSASLMCVPLGTEAAVVRIIILEG